MSSVLNDFLSKTLRIDVYNVLLDFTPIHHTDQAKHHCKAAERLKLQSDWSFGDSKVEILSVTKKFHSEHRTLLQWEGMEV